MFYRLLCYLAFICSCGSAQAATLHAVIAAHTTDESIGTGVQSNVRHMTTFLKQIANGADLDLNLMVFRDQEFDSHVVFDYVKNLDVAPDDVLIYYHSSHGFRTPQMQEQWPGLFFGWDQNALRLQDVAAVIEAKPLRFGLVVAEVCNNTMPSGPMFYKMNLTDLLFSSSKMNYHKLFREFCGTIVASSSEPGQYSWINLFQGGLYTNSFLDACRAELKSSDPNWHRVMQKASEGASKMALRCGKIQNPICDVQERR